MRILHLLSQTAMTGAEAYAKELVDHQFLDGNLVFVISDKIHVPLATNWISKPLSTSSFFIRLKNIIFLRKFIKSKQIELIHCHSRGAVRHAYWAKWGLKVAMVSTIHGRQHSSISKRLFDSYGELKLLVCENLKTQFIRDFKVKASSLRISRNPFSTEQYPFQNTITLEKRWAYIGRASGPKGKVIKEFFQKELFSYLKNHPQVKMDLIIPHAADFGDEFLNEIKKYTQIQLMGPYSSLSEIYPRYSLIFAAGRVAVEALLSGIPVIAIGEYTSLGLVRPGNFDECLKTNFGDMGTDDLSRYDFKMMMHNLDQHISDTERKMLSDLCKQNYSKTQVLKQVTSAYNDAVFKVHVPQHLPILMYHKIPLQELQSKHRIFVRKDDFEKHLFFLANNQYTCLHFQDLKDFMSGKRPYSEFPKKPLILTFDDGYRDNLTNALPLLEKYQIKATIFLLSDHSITYNFWDENDETTPSEIMSLTEKKILARSPFIEVGSHGIDHPKLTEISSTEALKQMQESKKQLENDLNKPVCCFAYPFGLSSNSLQTLCEEAGYDFAVNTDHGGLHMYENRFALFRVNIFPEDSVAVLKKKTSRFYRKYFYLKRGH